MFFARNIWMRLRQVAGRGSPTMDTEASSITCRECCSAVLGFAYCEPRCQSLPSSVTLRNPSTPSNSVYCIGSSALESVGLVLRGENLPAVSHYYLSILIVGSVIILLTFMKIHIR